MSLNVHRCRETQNRPCPALDAVRGIMPLVEIASEAILTGLHLDGAADVIAVRRIGGKAVDIE
jgi:hypothetical protein